MFAYANQASTHDFMRLRIDLLFIKMVLDAVEFIAAEIGGVNSKGAYNKFNSGSTAPLERAISIEEEVVGDLKADIDRLYQAWNANAQKQKALNSSDVSLMKAASTVPPMATALLQPGWGLGGLVLGSAESLLSGAEATLKYTSIYGESHNYYDDSEYAVKRRDALVEDVIDKDEKFGDKEEKVFWAY